MPPRLARQCTPWCPPGGFCHGRGGPGEDHPGGGFCGAAWRLWSPVDLARAVRGALWGWGTLYAGAGGAGTCVSRTWRAGGGGTPEAAGPNLADADAGPGACRRPGDAAAPHDRSDAGTDAAGADRSP